MNPPHQEQSQVTQLFSHLEWDGNQFKHQPGSVLGSIALIAGTTIGAGILALPSVTLPSGLVPSSTVLILVWLYTLVSSLLVAEITLHTMRCEGLAHVGLLAIVAKTWGNLGARIAGVTYLFMHYGILVAYIAKGGELLIYAATKILGLEQPLPNWLGTTTFTLIFGGTMYLGRERFVQKLNSIFVLIVIASFLGLMLLGVGQIKSSYLLFQNWTTAGNAISIMFVAMFFHNIVPTVVTQLAGDVTKIRRSIMIGSLTPLIMYLAWNAVVLGSVNPDILKDISGIFDPLQVLRNGSSGAWLSILVTIFSEFAIVTSFIGFVYSLLDFYQDFYLIAQSEISSFPLYSLVLLPPLGLGTINPNIFFIALEYTGILTNSILGVIIPALISWKQRQQISPTDDQSVRLVPGGKLTLVVILLIGISLIIKQVSPL
jgi:tyrosine-specific transport protein